MNIGILNTYWLKEWRADYLPFIKQARRIGCDVLELSIADEDGTDRKAWKTLGEAATGEGILLTAAMGLSDETSISSADRETAARGVDILARVSERIAAGGLTSLSGVLYSACPGSVSTIEEKKAHWNRSVENMRKVARAAANYGVTINVEVLHRFEGFLLNTAAEAVQYCKDVGEPNIKVLMDTYHMNMEEASFSGALITAGTYLGELHVGEYNRGLPGYGRLPWTEIAAGLHAIGYEGNVIAEPFVQYGSRVGTDVKLFHPLYSTLDEARLDEMGAESIAFLRRILTN